MKSSERGTRGRARVAALAFVACWPAAAAAQAGVPERLGVVHPSCEGPLPWDALATALRVELRTMGSDLALDASDAPARLVVNTPCAADAARMEATLIHLESGRAISEWLEIGADVDRVRQAAVSLSELVRSRWAELVIETLPAHAPALREVEIGAERALAPVPSSAPAAPIEARIGPMLDVGLGVTAHPAGAHMVGQLRAALSLPLAPWLRLGVELGGSAGWAGDLLGDVVLGGASGAIALRFAHVRSHVLVEAGPRAGAGWSHALGLAREGAIGASHDAASLMFGADARVRTRIERELWLLIGIELGASVLGTDARAAGRRVTAELGPLLGLVIGAAWSL